MEYTRKRQNAVNEELTNLIEIYRHDLQLYELPPPGEMMLYEFEQLGVDRLRVLQFVDSLSIRSDLNSMEEKKKFLSAALKKENLKYFETLLYSPGCKSHTEADVQLRRKDLASHYIMRMAYCDEPEKANWFITQEIEFFKLRFSSLDKEGREQFFAHNLDSAPISQEEKELHREGLYASVPKVTSIDTTNFYKVQFENVIELVRTRRVFLKESMAYLSEEDMVSVFANRFRKILTEGLEKANVYLTNIWRDKRLIGYFQSLPGYFSGMTRLVWSSTTTPIEKLDELSKTSYPLCMRSLHETLRTNHHLRNEGRMQYGLFVKGIGVTLEDALHFWKDEFTKKMDADKFEKQYAYSIRHTFGEEGKRTNYTPMGCQKIIMRSVGPGEHHGCPFRHMDSDSLFQKLVSYGTPASSIKEILELSKSGHYQLACTKYFMATHHGHQPDAAFMHPNAYYAESRAFLEKDNTSTETVKSEKSFQSGKPVNEKLNMTPSSTNRYVNSTPSRQSDTPSRSNSTPSCSTVTPASTDTPARKIIRKAPTNIEKSLNMDEIEEWLMDDN